MNTIPTQISLDDWEKFGGGFTADSFYHKTDNSIMMKLYAAFMGSKDPLTELELAEEVVSLGIPTAKPLEYVQAGDRFGSVFERLVGKRSIARILADEPERLDEMAHVFATEIKKLHSTECDTTRFSSAKKTMKGKIEASSVLSAEVKEKAIKVIDGAGDFTTCLHGDCHIGNMLIVNNKPYFIDLGDFAYGDPMFDLGLLLFQAEPENEAMSEELYHISLSRFREFWDRFKVYYFDNPDGIEEKLMPYVGLTAALYVAKIGHVIDPLDRAIKRCLI